MRSGPRRRAHRSCRRRRRSALRQSHAGAGNRDCSRRRQHAGLDDRPGSDWHSADHRSTASTGAWCTAWHLHFWRWAWRLSMTLKQGRSIGAGASDSQGDQKRRTRKLGAIHTSSLDPRIVSVAPDPVADCIGPGLSRKPRIRSRKHSPWADDIQVVARKKTSPPVGPTGLRNFYKS